MLTCLAFLGLFAFLANLLALLGKGFCWILAHVFFPIIKFVLGPAMIVTIVLFTIGLIIAACRV